MTEEHVHGNGPRGVISCVLDALGTPRHDPDPAEVDALRRKMVVVARNVKRQYHRSTLFYRAPFRRFLLASIELARRQGWIRE